MKTFKIEINNEADLKSVAAILHDARLTANEMSFDAGPHTFTLKCWLRGLETMENGNSVLAQLKQQEEIGLARKPQQSNHLKMLLLAVWRRLLTRNVLVEPRIWEACRLSFANVTSCKANVKEMNSYYELATIRFSEPECQINLITHCGMEIRLQVATISGALSELDETREQW